ncbi:MAG: hypothetical protein JWP75_275, partial [Frondihabitans sp.]|nr:hypothetical protein [Frondihabitans sp.]
MNGSNQGIVKPLRIVNAILLLSVAAIHLFLVFHGVGGTLGVLFILNAVAAIALAVGLCALHGRRLKAAAML